MKIRHIVMWKFRTDGPITPSMVAQNMKSRLEALNGKIDGLIRIEVGINDIESSSAFDAVLVSEFESLQALENYKKHPLHIPISQYCKEHRTDRKTVDYYI